MHPQYTPADAARFWSKVDRSADCWLWQASCNPVTGYGQIMLQRKMLGAHRAAWLLTYGAIPAGMYICHRCDNPPCCRPDHLFLGSQAVNMRDCAAKGRASRGEQRPASRLTPDDVRSIRASALTGETQARIAARFDVAEITVHKILRGRTWRHVQ